MPTLSERFLTLHPGALFGRGASADEVAEAELRLGVSFPESLRRYLMELGYVEAESMEFFGLGAGVPEHLNLVARTISERTTYHPNIPRHLLPVLNDGCGNRFCLDLRDGNADPPMVFWCHELGTDQAPSVIATSFTSWLLDDSNDEAL